MQSSVFPNRLQEAVCWTCTCGFRLTGRASCPPRYCGGCGASVTAGDFEADGTLQVLVVEDSKTVRTAISATIRKMDCQVREARDGRDAMTLIHADCPDLVVTDLMMPHVNGIELLHHLRADPRYRELAVAVLTSVEDAEILEQVMQQRVLAYVVKSQVDRQQLQRRLRQCVEAARQLISRRHLKEVLVVEDSMLRRALSHMLRTMGCQVQEAENGEVALTMLEKRRPDLVICDIEMPRLDGLKLLEILRCDQRFRELPVVMLTTRSDASSMKRAIEAGVIAYLIKDQLKPQDLRQQLEECLVVATS